MALIPGTPIDSQLLLDGVEIGIAVIDAIIKEIRAGGTKQTAIAMAQGVIDRARAVDADVDAVAAGKA